MKKYKVKLNAYQLGFLHGILNNYRKNSDLNHGTDIAESIDKELIKIIKTFYDCNQ